MNFPKEANVFISSEFVLTFKYAWPNKDKNDYK